MTYEEFQEFRTQVFGALSATEDEGFWGSDRACCAELLEQAETTLFGEAHAKAQAKEERRGLYRKLQQEFGDD